MKPTKLSYFMLLFVVATCMKLYAMSTGLGKITTIVWVLKSDSRIPSATTYHDLSKLILELSINQAMAVQASFIEMAQHFPTEEALGQCAGEFYNDSIESFNKALSDLDKDL